MALPKSIQIKPSLTKLCLPKQLLRRRLKPPLNAASFSFGQLKMSFHDSVASDGSESMEEAPLVKTTEAEASVFTDSPLPSRSVKLAIYVSHALSTWSDRTMAFAAGLIFLEIYKNSLFYVSLFGLIQALASVLFSPSVGVYIDKTPRFRAVCVFYFLQNLGLALAALASLVLLARHAHPNGVVGTLAALGVVGAGTLAKVGTMGGTIAIEKDWTKALAGSNSGELAKLNSTLKMIDLTCLIVAPIVSGVLMSTCSMTVAVIQILIYNLLAWFPEVALLKYATSYAPALQSRAKAVDASLGETPPWTQKLQLYGQSLLEGFQLYFSQACVLASLSLAILHLTVLSFGILMTAYLKWLGLSEAGLSLYRGLGALTGVLGARAFPIFHAKLGLRSSGLLSISFFLTCILAGALPDILSLFISVAASPRFNFLVWAVAVSRFGLWVFDLSVSQIIQEWVDESQLGRVSGTQKLLENGFTFFIFIAGLIAPHPEQFGWLMMISVGAVASSFVLFSLFLMKSSYTTVATHPEIEMTNETPV